MYDRVNLWELLNAQSRRDNKDIGPEVADGFMRSLGAKGRFFQSEFSIEPVEKGWMIELFSCSDPHDSIQILIPSDGKQPVRILKDRVGRVEFHHDN